MCALYQSAGFGKIVRNKKTPAILIQARGLKISFRKIKYKKKSPLLFLYRQRAETFLTASFLGWALYDFIDLRRDERNHSPLIVFK
jgi:hypothetical protein